MFNKINNINTYKNCLNSINTIDLLSVLPKQKLINNNLTKSIQTPITTLNKNNLNNTISSYQNNNINQSLSSTSYINNQKITQENENLNKKYHTLNNTSKIFSVNNNINLETSIEILHSNKQYNIMVEKTTVSEEPQEININTDDLKKSIFKDVPSIDNQKDISDGATVITDDEEQEVLKEENQPIQLTEEKDLGSYDEIDVLGDDNFDDKNNIEDKLYAVKNKIHDMEKTDSEATVVSSPSIIHSEASVDEVENHTVNKFKILYSCSNEPKNYRTTNLPSICKKDCGEDAYFELDQNNFMVFGIADGVGGWNKSGVDPSLFAWDLMNSCKEVSGDLEDWPDPKTVLIDGYDMVIRKKEVKAGSSTACILTLDKISGIIYSTNLGDSGFSVIRDNKVIFKTQEQQHYFNAPYQLSIIPDNSIAYLQNTPHDAYDDQFTAEEGDVIILGTDGLWDNMYDEDIINIIKNDINNIKESKAEVKTKEEYEAWEKETNEVLSGLSFQLTQQTKKYSQDWYRESPFSKKFSSTGQYYSGGKVDDITIILMYVTYDRYTNIKPKTLIK